MAAVPSPAQAALARGVRPGRAVQPAAPGAGFGDLMAGAAAPDGDAAAAARPGGPAVPAPAAPGLLPSRPKALGAPPPGPAPPPPPVGAGGLRAAAPSPPAVGPAAHPAPTLPVRPGRGAPAAPGTQCDPAGDPDAGPKGAGAVGAMPGTPPPAPSDPALVAVFVPASPTPTLSTPPGVRPAFDLSAAPAAPAASSPPPGASRPLVVPHDSPPASLPGAASAAATASPAASAVLSPALAAAALTASPVRSASSSGSAAVPPGGAPVRSAVASPPDGPEPSAVPTAPAAGAPFPEPLIRPRADAPPVVADAASAVVPVDVRVDGVLPTMASSSSSPSVWPGVAVPSPSPSSVFSTPAAPKGSVASSPGVPGALQGPSSVGLVRAASRDGAAVGAASPDRGALVGGTGLPGVVLAADRLPGGPSDPAPASSAGRPPPTDAPVDVLVAAPGPAVPVPPVLPDATVPAAVLLASSPQGGHPSGDGCRPPEDPAAQAQPPQADAVGGPGGLGVASPDAPPALPGGPASILVAGKASGPSSRSGPTRAAEAAVEALGAARDPGARTFVSVEPEGLGRVSVTVERGLDGVAAIHVSAERLSTLEMLRDDRAGMSGFLAGSGQAGEGHTLSFSWDGPPGGRQPPWEGLLPAAIPSGPALADPVRAYPTDPSSAGLRAAARGGVDVTA